MRSTYTELYMHLIWGTWDRLPLITVDVEAKLYAAMNAKIQDLKCELVAIGGIDQQVHLLIRLHPMIAISDLVKEIKGSSSHFMTHVLAPNGFFKWQGSYSAFTLRKSDAPQLIAHIDNQKQHHQSCTTIAAWEEASSDD